MKPTPQQKPLQLLIPTDQAIEALARIIADAAIRKLAKRKPPKPKR